MDYIDDITAIETTASEALVVGRRTPRIFTYAVVKRFFDTLAALVLLLVLSPVLLTVALLIRLDSPGSPIYVQRRAGARRRRLSDGRVVWDRVEFPMFKFRSMRAGASQNLHQDHIKAWVNGTAEKAADSNAGFKIQRDPRITRIGSLIRRTSIDELPQLWNVVRGDMSLIGPRPVPLYEAAEYNAVHRQRFLALPGMTGLWQVEGRGIATFEESIRLDIEYVRRQSFALDVEILIKTLPAVLFARGAK
jgi:exopolysaccharide production protein ExoY